MVKDNRTLLVILLAGIIIIALLDQTMTMRLLGTVQSLVIILLGITATLYLWKRM